VSQELRLRPVSIAHRVSCVRTPQTTKINSGIHFSLWCERATTFQH
jgi:hypothetical protein